MRKVLAVTTAVVLLAGIGLGGLALLESRRVAEIERLDEPFEPTPGYTDTRRAALDSTAPDVLAQIDNDQVLLDQAASALLRVRDTGLARCDDVRDGLLLPWTKERARLHCETASEYVLDWAHRTVWSDLYDAVLARCLQGGGPDDLMPHLDFEGYAATDPGLDDAAYAKHAALLEELRTTAAEIATQVTCGQMVRALSAA